MRPEKTQLVQGIRELVETPSGLFMISFEGLTAEQFNELRRQVAERDARCRVVPRRLLMRAADAAGLAAIAEADVNGEVALVSGGSDPVALAKCLKDFGKDHDEVTVRFGVLDSQHLSGAEVQKLADLPPVDVLQAQFLSVLLAPARQTVQVLHAKMASVVYVLSAYLNEKEKAA